MVIVATIGNTLGSLVAYAIGAWGGRPFLERYGKYMLIREHELEVADHFFARYGSATVFIGRLLPIVRTFISFPAGVARMPLGKFIVYSTLGAFPWSDALVWAGLQLGANWVTIRDMLKPFDMAIAAGVIVAVPGPRSGGGWGCRAGRRRPRRPPRPAPVAEPAVDPEPGHVAPGACDAPGILPRAPGPRRCACRSRRGASRPPARRPPSSAAP